MGQEYVVIANDKDGTSYKEGDEIYLTFNPEKISLFDIDTEENLEA